MGRRSGEDNGLSGLPEEWGRVVVPDDAAALDDLAAEVREELRYEARVSRRERRLPFIVLALTVLITMASLFAVPWLGAGPSGDPSPGASTSAPVSTSEAVSNPASPLPDSRPTETDPV